MSSPHSKLKSIFLNKVVQNKNIIPNDKQVKKIQNITYPKLPKYQEVEDAKLEIENQINTLKNSLYAAKRERYMLLDRQNNYLKYYQYNLEEYHSNLYPVNIVKELEEQNLKKKSKAEQTFTLSDKPCFGCIYDLCQYAQNIKTQNENVALLYTSMYWYKSMCNEMKFKAAKQYSRIRKVWSKEYNHAVNTINIKFHNDANHWGKEQISTPTVPYEGKESCLGIAPDVKMDFKNELCPVFIFADDNNFVSDPVGEHNKYKNRIKWNLEEKRLYICVFWKTPHKFKEIAKYFPGKTTKDMIEFYYLSKQLIYRNKPRNVFGKKQK